MNKKYTAKFALRFLSIIMIVTIIVVFLLSILFVNNLIGHKGSETAVNGYLDISNKSILKDVIHLAGEWEVFEGVVCKSEEDVKNLGQAPKLAKLPIGGMEQANKNATYRLYFSIIDNKKENIFLHISTFYKSADIYLNGVKQEYYQEDKALVKFSTMESLVRLDNINYENQWQEIVITAPFKDSNTTLHKREIVIGTIKNISELAVFISSNEMLIFGLLVLILLNGYVFMLFRPEHRIISYMTIFDTMILVRTVLSMNHVISFAREIFPWLYISDKINSSMSLFFLMVGGMVGCKLSGAIYDPDNRAPQWFIKPLPWIYIVFAATFPFLPRFFNTYGRAILIPVYIVTFIGVFIQYKISLENKERRVYNILQFVKTVYIGIMIFVDIMLWNTSTDLLSLFYLYTVFFMLHVVVRLYDNNQSYVDVERLNEGLEDTVEQRTKELSQANRVLSELSIKDPLTQIFNRLYFERSIEEAVVDFDNKVSLHICMFDLDFFKKINDTYGHSAGDEQLKAVCELVRQKIEDKATFARIGGEEFVLLFRGFTDDEVVKHIEEVRLVIDNDARANLRHTTASFGVARFYEGDTVKEMMKRADIALYEAKDLGRNRVMTNFNNEFDEICRHANRA